MQQFIDKYGEQMNGVLTGLDRLVFRAVDSGPDAKAEPASTGHAADAPLESVLRRTAAESERRGLAGCGAELHCREPLWADRADDRLPGAPLGSENLSSAVCE